MNLLKELLAKYKNINTSFNEYFKPEVMILVSKIYLLAGAFTHILSSALYFSSHITVLAINSLLDLALFILFFVIFDENRIRYIYTYVMTIIELFILFNILCLGWNYNMYIYSFMLIPLSILSSISIKEKRYNVVLPILHFIITQGILLFIQIKNFIKPIEPIYQLTKKQQEVFATHGIIVYCVTTIATFIPLLAFLLDLNKTYARIDKMNEDLKYTATRDHLTGLINRHSIQEYFEEALTNYNTNNKPFSVILADIDNFKKVNDTYGHTAGDLVLQGVSYIMTSSVSNTDFVCRWGGEEILILTYTDLDSAIALAEKIRESISHATFISEEVEINVTITSGIATYKSNSSIDEIIQLADTNLYKGKNSTKNCVIS